MAPGSTSSNSSGSDDEKIVHIHDGPLRDCIHIRNPLAHTRDVGATKYLVFMITGNPGLIEYYREFLGRLNHTVKQQFSVASDHGQAQNIDFEFYGHSMGGFEVEKRKTQEQKRRHNSCYDLKQQVSFIEECLMERVKQITEETGGQRPKVILMGHSVGSYVLLEVVQRHRKRLETTQTEKAANGLDIHNEPDIVSGICLFPTIVDIGKSAQGQIMTSLSRIPLFLSLVSHFVRALTTILPSMLLHRLVSAFTGMPHHPATVTAAFLSSRIGVQQALHMGVDEMRTITTDQWDSEVWGAAHPSPCGVSRPQLFFYFGKTDHWVADHTRDEVIALRGRCEGDKDEWRPRMEVDEMGVPHGFCISEPLERNDYVKAGLTFQ